VLNHTITKSLVPKFAAEHSPRLVVPLHLAPPRPDTRADDIATISHELRNCLAVVRNSARLLGLSNKTETIDRARVLIERQVAHMCRHVEDLMALASPPAGKQATTHRSHIDLRTIVENAIAANAHNIERHRHRLVVELPEEPVWVHADAPRLEQVFSNILINAAKYTPAGGKIILTLDRHHSLARIRIRDSGIGIEADMLLRVFELYEQVDAQAPCSEGGRGIGLALVRGLVENHGGTVQASSDGLGLGSEFTVTLPQLWGTASTASNGLLAG
jgi:signal transduction histidine kinase